MTTYRTINILSKNVNDILSSIKKTIDLLNIKNKINERNNLLFQVTKQITPEHQSEILDIFNDGKIFLLSSEKDKYTCILSEEYLMNENFTKILSRNIDNICILSEFNDFEIYEITFFRKGEYIEKISRKMNLNNEKIDLCENNRLFSVLNFTSSQIMQLNEALNINDILDSFIDVEAILNAYMTIDYDFMDDKTINDLKRKGIKVYTENI